MDILKKHIDTHRLLTIEDLKKEELTIEVVKANLSMRGIYRLDSYGDKIDVSCTEEMKVDCNKVCKDYCLYFIEENDTDIVWSCNIKEWRRA